jgi:ketosteroid isomerase-like protein
MGAGEREIILKAYDAWNRRDYGQAIDFLDPDVEVDASARVMNPDVYRGHAGFQRLIDEIAEVWEQWRIEPEEFIEGDGGILVVARARARGRGSGVELDQVAYNTWRLRDGKVVRAAFFYDKADALQDVS